MFKAILNKPHDYRNFTVENNLIFLKSGQSKVLCIPKVLIDGRSAPEIIISEAHSLLAHLGASKFFSLWDHVWWKDLVSDTKAFCETCTMCKHSKLSNQKPYGLLNQLPVPSQPWESIGIDFVGDMECRYTLLKMRILAFLHTNPTIHLIKLQ